MSINIKSAEKFWPNLKAMVSEMELDNGSQMSHWPDVRPEKEMDALNKLASRLTPAQVELLACGEEDEAQAFANKNKLQPLCAFLNDVFNYVAPVKEPNWWEVEDSESQTPAPEARKKDTVSKKQKEAVPSTQTIKKPQTGLEKAVAAVKAKAVKTAKVAPVQKAAKVKAPKPAPGLNPDLVTLLKAIKARTGKGKSPVGNMVPRAKVDHGFMFQKSGGLYSRGKQLGLLEVAEHAAEEGEKKVSSTALTQAGLDAISKPSKAAASSEMGLE